MISANQYQDIELQQNADFSNVITFDDTHTMLSTMSYAAVIIKDYDHTSFTGPNKTTGTDGTASGSDVWASGSVTEVHFDVVADRSSNAVTLTLPAEAIQYFADDFEGYWDLVEKDSAGGGAYVRQIQGDVVISKGAVKLDMTFTDSVE
jgi:hypothetical protein